MSATLNVYDDDSLIISSEHPEADKAISEVIAAFRLWEKVEGEVFKGRK